MQLFYHGTRDIELPTAGRGAGPSQATRHCEACGAELVGDDASEGSAHGLLFCAECRRRVDRSAIQIHFCDACGVSVPMDDVDEGRALSADGRILCGVCRAPAPVPAARRRWLLAALAALGALLVGAMAAWLS